MKHSTSNPDPLDYEQRRARLIEAIDRVQAQVDINNTEEIELAIAEAIEEVRAERRKKTQFLRNDID